MESYKHYQQAKLNTKSAFEWMANKDKIDSQDHKPYALNKVSVSAEYCGQAYAGATNYHKSPEAFNTALEVVIRMEFGRLSQLALERLRDVERVALIGCEDDISAITDEIATAKAAQ